MWLNNVACIGADEQSKACEQKGRQSCWHMACQAMSSMT
jgi:hypothetical protein